MDHHRCYRVIDVRVRIAEPVTRPETNKDQLKSAPWYGMAGSIGDSLSNSASPGLKSVLEQDPVIGTSCQPLCHCASAGCKVAVGMYLAAVDMWHKHLLLCSVPTAALDENYCWRLMPSRSPWPQQVCGLDGGRFARNRPIPSLVPRCRRGMVRGQPTAKRRSGFDRR